MGSATVKKPAALSRSAIDTKFTARGVSPRMIREATGVEKLELTQIRSLLAIFEEAHERNWDVAKGPWAHAVEFYQFAFQETLPEVEPGLRDSLIMDFVKRCCGIVLARDGLRIEPSSVVDVQATDDVVTTEVVAFYPAESFDGAQRCVVILRERDSGQAEPTSGGYPQMVLAAGAVGAPQLPLGTKLVESPAKVFVPEGGYPLGSSTPTAATTPAKLVSLSEAEEEAAYDARVAKLANIEPMNLLQSTGISLRERRIAR